VIYGTIGFMSFGNRGFDYVLTAHQVDDNIETFHQSKLRYRTEGLVGIPAQNDKIFSPLLLFFEGGNCKLCPEKII
jgi:tRNA(Ile)-lysidine synthase